MFFEKYQGVWGAYYCLQVLTSSELMLEVMLLLAFLKENVALLEQLLDGDASPFRATDHHLLVHPQQPEARSDKEILALLLVEALDGQKKIQQKCCQQLVAIGDRDPSMSR